MLGYVRYVDNLLFIVDTVEHATSLLQALSSIAPYSGKLEEMSSSAISFLDMTLFKQNKGEYASVGFAPQLKSVGPILSHRSSHVPSVHIAWPISLLFAAWRRSSSLVEFEQYKQCLLLRLKRSGLSHSFISTIDSETLFVAPFCPTRSRKLQRKQNIVWQSFEYHPLLYKCIPGTIRRFFDENENVLHDIFGSDAPVVQTAWKLQSVPFANSLVAW